MYRVRFRIGYIFCFIACGAFGQSAQIDSLQNLIKDAPDSKEKVELLNQLSFALFGFDVEKAGASTQLALRISQQIQDKKGEAWATSYRGIYFLFSGALKSASDNFTRSLVLAKELNESNLQTYSLMQLGNVYRDHGIFDSALLYYNEADEFSSQHPDDLYRSMVKMNKGRYYLILNQPDSALIEIEEARKLRESLRDPSLIVDVWLLLGNSYRQKYDLKKAEEYYDLVLKATPAQSISRMQYLLNMGEIYFNRGDFASALANWSQVLAFHRKLNYKYELAALLLRMGEVFEEQGYYELAIEHLSNSLQISEKASYRYLMGEVFYELAWVFYRNNNLNQAQQAIKKSEVIFTQTKQPLRLAGCLNVKGLIQYKKNDYDSSLYYHRMSLAARERIGDKAAISSSVYNLGELFNARKEYQKALQFLWRGLKIDESIGDNYGKSLYYYQLGRGYNLQGKYDSVKYYLEKSLALAVPSSATDVLRNGYGEMATYLENVNKPHQANLYYKRFIQLTDSLYNKQASQTLASFRTLYDVETKEKEIELLNKSNQLAKSEAQRQNILLVSASIGLIVLIGLSVFYYRFARRLKKLNVEIMEKSEEIQTQSEELTEANHALSSLNRKISEQKEEIQAQAEELTESNQAILSINETLEQRIELRTAELKQAYKELDTFFYRSSHDFRRPLTTFMGLAEVAKITIKDAMALELFEKVNQTAHNLDKMLIKFQSISSMGADELVRKEIFVEDKLKRYLTSFADELEQRKIRVQLNVEPDLSIVSYPALLGVVISNLIENSISFSSDKDPSISIRAFRNGRDVVLEVEDNGQGIEEQYQERVFEMYFRGNDRSKGNGLGLFIVKKAVDKLKGRVSINSAPGQGTIISVVLPNL